jgi:hypothetical protein
MESIAQSGDDRRHRSLHVSRAAVREAEKTGQLGPINLAKSGFSLFVDGRQLEVPNGKNT